MTEKNGELKTIIHLSEFVFTQNTLERILDASKKGIKNEHAFSSALKSGFLDIYANSFVLYVDGALSGQSKDKELLIKARESYYSNQQGSRSDIDIYQVPEMETVRALREKEE